MIFFPCFCFLPCEGGEALAQVAQRSCDVPGSLEVSLEQCGTVEDVPALWYEVGLMGFKVPSHTNHSMILCPQVPLTHGFQPPQRLSLPLPEQPVPEPWESMKSRDSAPGEQWNCPNSEVYPSVCLPQPGDPRRNSLFPQTHTPLCHHFFTLLHSHFPKFSCPPAGCPLAAGTLGLGTGVSLRLIAVFLLSPQIPLMPPRPANW